MTIKYAAAVLLVIITSGCHLPTTTTSSSCLELKSQCESQAIDKAIRDGIVQEQLLDAFGNDSSPEALTKHSENCYSKYIICTKQKKNPATS